MNNKDLRMEISEWAGHVISSWEGDIQAKMNIIVSSRNTLDINFPTAKIEKPSLYHTLKEPI